MYLVKSDYHKKETRKIDHGKQTFPKEELEVKMKILATETQTWNLIHSFTDSKGNI